MQGCCGLPCAAGSVPPRGGTALLHVASAVSRWTPAQHEAPRSLVVSVTGDCADCYALAVNAVLSHLLQRNRHLLHSTRSGYVQQAMPSKFLTASRQAALAATLWAQQPC